MGINLNRMVDQVAKEKGISRDTLVEALEAALISAARKKYGNRVELEAQYSEETGEVEVFAAVSPLCRSPADEEQDPEVGDHDYRDGGQGGAIDGHHRPDSRLRLSR